MTKYQKLVKRYKLDFLVYEQAREELNNLIKEIEQSNQKLCKEWFDTVGKGRVWKAVWWSPGDLFDVWWSPGDITYYLFEGKEKLPFPMLNSYNMWTIFLNRRVRVGFTREGEVFIHAKHTLEGDTIRNYKILSAH